ncbi:hypothetical protein FKM82_013430 [Ascaphus truei]
MFAEEGIVYRAFNPSLVCLYPNCEVLRINNGKKKDLYAEARESLQVTVLLLHKYGKNLELASNSGRLRLSFVTWIAECPV